MAKPGEGFHRNITLRSVLSSGSPDKKQAYVTAEDCVYSDYLSSMYPLRPTELSVVQNTWRSACKLASELTLLAGDVEVCLRTLQCSLLELKRQCDGKCLLHLNRALLLPPFQLHLVSFPQIFSSTTVGCFSKELQVNYPCSHNLITADSVSIICKITAEMFSHKWCSLCRNVNIYAVRQILLIFQMGAYLCFFVVNLQYLTGFHLLKN